ncbi:uncharacterized protein AKAW2_41105S [Aspergillus luchuensis]|uniref:Uncharacterized protein n=1 Tax=Aspergillus kawachii TaxID=1069201 RepID=A0A146EZ76_ASPKA|nr:uncharacterized protein AKAW2_41105S [Aspergillus luchuensis]BCR99422.1 hypothetical protein AKAW2_41105S [Aspergillus luchuensis]BCS11724.1 hypothetical protein ALUC_41064S [Aspergillus luchuensis]GAA90763.1 hypothetical protein AKAW_08877 [Aspergillus luchuensis IFO 4308]GAT19327.1 hypothetical protein RIB2604_00402640 [Aspergillus luchuensis]
MCQYTFHNNPDCGHIANFSLDICVDMMNAMREGTKNPPDHKVTTVHDLLPKGPFYQCRPCEGKLAKVDTNCSDCSDSEYVVLEGQNAGVPIVHSYMEMCLNEKNTPPDGCDNFVHVNQPPRLGTPTPAPKPMSASQTLKMRDLASSESEIHPPLNMMETLEGYEDFLKKSNEQLRARRPPSTPIRSPESGSYGDTPVANQSWYASDSDTETDQVQSPRPLGAPFSSPHRAPRPKDAPLRVSDLNSPPPSQQPGYLKATPRLTKAGIQGEAAPVYRSNGATTPPNQQWYSTLLPCTPSHLIIPQRYSPPSAPRKTHRTEYSQYNPVDTSGIPFRREYRLPRHDVLNTVLQSPPSQYPESYNRSYSRQYWGAVSGMSPACDERW